MTTSKTGLQRSFPRDSHSSGDPGSAVGDRVPLRMRMTPGRSGALDGAWWPQTGDLAIELADLVDHFPRSIGRVDRAVFSPPDWLPAPRRIPIERGFLKVGSFPRDDTHVVLLRLSTGQMLRMLVVPPATSTSQAEQVMRVAVRANNHLDGPTILEMTADQGRDRDESADHWNDDGGAADREERTQRPPAG